LDSTPNQPDDKPRNFRSFNSDQFPAANTESSSSSNNGPPYPALEFLGKSEDASIGWSKDMGGRVLQDFKNNYASGQSLLCMGVAIGIAAPIANTNADQSIRNWFQDHVRNSGTDRLANGVMSFGDYSKAGSAMLGVWVVSRLSECCLTGTTFGDADACVGDWSERSLRAWIVGAPAIGALQYGLGGTRPEPNGTIITTTSRWFPYHAAHVTASGHSFIGAVPFLTAASMTDCLPLQATFFLGSLLTPFARVDVDAHYFSQALLGWSIASIAVQSVNRTDDQRIHVAPLAIPNNKGQATDGLGIQIDY
jgi:hypothetical protein